MRLVIGEEVERYFWEFKDVVQLNMYFYLILENDSMIKTGDCAQNSLYQAW